MAMTAEALRSLPARLVSQATGANPRTVERWRAGTTPRRSEYRGPTARQAWLTARSAHLGWRRPIDVLAAGDFESVRGAALAYAAGDPT
jgi:hypothetical protein